VLRAPLLPECIKEMGGFKHSEKRVVTLKVEKGKSEENFVNFA